MRQRKKKEGISVLDAVDNLTHMAEIDLNVPDEALAGVELTEAQVSERLESLSWHSPEYFAYNRDRVKETFRVILSYLKHLYENDKGKLRDPDTQRGVQAIMILANESAHKLDKHTALFKGEKEEKISEIKEYQDLQHFYLTKVVNKFQGIPEKGGPWDEEWTEAAEGELVDAHQQALKDLETIRKDKEYELFLIRKEDGRPFFNKELLRHLRLVEAFDGALASPGGEDPFLKVKMMQDRELHLSAKEILHQVAPYVDDYYKEALRYKDMEFVASINKALMALMLAANSRNLMQNSSGKSSLSYYEDFHFYLRKAIASHEYGRFLSTPPDQSSRFFHTLINLSHGLCTSFFMRTTSRSEMISFIRLLIEKGGKNVTIEKPTHTPLALWNTLLDEDGNIRQLLAHYPNGPLLKAIDVFRAEHYLTGFDPLAQENIPSQMYAIVSDEMHISCLRIPCPSRQEHINKAELANEFNGFLRALGSERKGQRHLLVNLQDRTSWQEHARCVLLEGMQKKAEYSHSLIVVTLPKNADFYLQSGPYVNVNSAQEFLKQFKEQIASGEQCGFFFPPGWNKEEFQAFAEEAMSVIHRLFFGGKETFVHKNRLDFIEIFYLFALLKIIDNLKPDSISFTCKDAVDTGAAASSEFFAFLRMMNSSEPWSKEEKNFLLWMLYSPALTLRERSIDESRLTRMVSALEVIQGELEAKHRDVIAAFAKLYKLRFFKDVKVHEVS